MTPRLQAYLALERAMMLLDDVGDPLADELRDRMDPIWHNLSDEDRDYLNSRRIAENMPIELSAVADLIVEIVPPHRVESAAIYHRGSELRRA